MSRVHLSWLAPCVLALTVALAITASSRATTHEATRSGGTFVYGTIFDPILLDPALAADPESDRVANQIFEGLVDVAPGRTRVVPGLATALAGEQGRSHLDLLPAPRREVPGRNSPQRRSSVLQLRTVVRLHRLTSIRGVVVGHGLRRLPPSGAVARSQSTGFYRSCQSPRQTHRSDPSRKRRTTSFLAALALSDLRNREPDGAQEVRRRRR